MKSDNSQNHTNRLIHESSPYLLQHAHNPVNWFAWSEEALEKARNENKLILVSVGYAACHWCHVMAHESFENEEIAAQMNRDFVCIKIDREERPDIDKIYMNAVQLITGQGGWPLNCFALPDGSPVWGGTYFRPEQWKQILESLTISYKTQPERFEQSAAEIKQGIINSDLISKNTESIDFSFEKLQNAVDNYKTHFDMKFGGTRNAPKFPLPVSLNFLIDYLFYTKDDTIQKYLSVTLEKMACGGIYDQIGGGFARYSTDEKWFAPHFEKMLYDNAQLISLYSKAFRQNPNPLYRKTVYETIEFCERELRSPENAFYSSLDADSEGEEGLFYVWNKSEIDEILGLESEKFCKYFNITEDGNWDNKKNILYVDSEIPEISDSLKKSISKLLNIRNKRIRPGLDDKILTSWNALMVSAYCEAFEAFGESSFLENAKQTADFILAKQSNSDFKLNRNFKNGITSINGFLDDYALTIEAFLNLYKSSNNEKFLKSAKHYADYTLNHFFNPETNLFFYTSDKDKVIVTRKTEIDDNVIASSNSVMSQNLYKLGIYFYDEKLTEIVRSSVNLMYNNIIRNIGFFSNWASLFINFSLPLIEIVIIGNQAVSFQNLLIQNRQNVIFTAISENESEIPIFKNRFIENRTAIYICKNHICKLPVFTIAEAKRLINQ